MARYIYKKYNSTPFSYPPVYELQQTGSNSGAPRSISGYPSYSYDSSTGVVTMTGTISSTTNGTRYSGGGSGVTREDTDAVGWSSVSYTSVLISSGGSGYTRGSYIGQVIAEDGTYPNNGRFNDDGFWYERIRLATPPTVTSPNGGETFDASHTITWTNSQTGLRYRVQLSLNNGSTWSTLISQTAVDATSYTYNFSNTSESSTARIRVIGVTNDADALLTDSDESNGVFTIKHNVAPTQPTNLSPSGGAVRDVNQAVTLSWRFNDANASDYQTKAEVNYRLQGATLWSVVNVNSSQEQYVLSAISAIGTYEWRVKTFDRDNVESPWSNTAVFVMAEPTTAPIIVSPTTSIAVSRPNIQWTGVAQQSYQVVIEDSLGAVLWDTGEVISPNQAVTSGIDLDNGGTYTFRVRIKDSGGLFSSFASVTSSVSFTPPVKPEVTVQEGDGTITLVINSASPTGTQPITESYEVYKELDGVFTLIAYGVNTSFTDYFVASGKEYRYYVKALGDNGTTRNSDTVTGMITLDGVYIHALREPAFTSYRFKYAGVGYSDNYEPESAVMKYAGRTRPVIHYGLYADYTISRRIQSVDGMEDIDALREFVRNRETVVYRDDDGNLIVGFLRNISVNKQYRVSEAEITVIETAHREGV